MKCLWTKQHQNRSFNIIFVVSFMCVPGQYPYLPTEEILSKIPSPPFGIPNKASYVSLNSLFLETSQPLQNSNPFCWRSMGMKQSDKCTCNFTYYFWIFFGPHSSTLNFRFSALIAVIYLTISSENSVFHQENFFKLFEDIFLINYCNQCEESEILFIYKGEIGCQKGFRCMHSLQEPHPHTPPQSKKINNNCPFLFQL